MLQGDLTVVTPRTRREELQEFGLLLFRLHSPRIPQPIFDAATARPNDRWFTYFAEWKSFAKATPLTLVTKRKPTKLELSRLSQQLRGDPCAVLLACERFDLTVQVSALAKKAAARITNQLLAQKPKTRRSTPGKRLPKP